MARTTETTLFSRDVLGRRERRFDGTDLNDRRQAGGAGLASARLGVRGGPF